jgi:hypothetical protein
MAPPAPAWEDYPAPGKAEELASLKAQSEYFKDTLEGIRKRIDELEAQQEDT